MVEDVSQVNRPTGGFFHWNVFSACLRVPSLFSPASRWKIRTHENGREECNELDFIIKELLRSRHVLRRYFLSTMEENLLWYNSLAALYFEKNLISRRRVSRRLRISPAVPVTLYPLLPSKLYVPLNHATTDIARPGWIPVIPRLRPFFHPCFFVN